MIHRNSSFAGRISPDRTPCSAKRNVYAMEYLRKCGNRRDTCEKFTNQSGKARTSRCLAFPPLEAEMDLFWMKADGYEASIPTCDINKNNKPWK